MHYHLVKPSPFIPDTLFYFIAIRTLGVSLGVGNSGVRPIWPFPVSGHSYQSENKIDSVVDLT